MFITEPIALQIKPKDSYTIPLYTLSSDDSTKAAPPFSLSAKTINTTRSYNYHINMKINGIPHTYIDNYADATQISGSLKSTRIDVSDTIYTPILRNVDLNNAAFYVDGTHLYGHITIKTTSGAAIASAQAAYRFVLPYFDQNSQYQEKQITIRLPQDFSIPAHKSAHYAFKVQLPADFSTRHAPQGIPLRPIALPGLTTILLGQVNNASEISKKDYTILSDITIEK